MKVQLAVAAAGVLAIMALPASARAQTTATWDELQGGNYIPTPLPYQNHNFYYGNGAFGIGSSLEYSTLGTRCHSSSNCAYNAFGSYPIRVESETSNAADAFTFSAFLSGGYPGLSGGGFSVFVQGFLGTSATDIFHATYFLPNDESWVNVNLGALAVNKVLFTSEDANGNAINAYMLLDDASFNGPGTNPGPTTTTPEPASIALLGTGLGAIALVRRRRRRAV